MMVLELDWLDASSFSADHALSRAPLYQTQLASDYYDQVLKLQGEQLKVHHLLTHLFDQHPHGLIPALDKMYEAISNGKQWRQISCVKVPVSMKVTSEQVLPPPPQEEELNDLLNEELVVLTQADPPDDPPHSVAAASSPPVHAAFDSSMFYKDSPDSSVRGEVMGLGLDILRAGSMSDGGRAGPSRTFTFLQRLERMASISGQPTSNTTASASDAVQPTSADLPSNLVLASNSSRHDDTARRAKSSGLQTLPEEPFSQPASKPASRPATSLALDQPQLSLAPVISIQADAAVGQQDWTDVAMEAEELANEFNMAFESKNIAEAARDAVAEDDAAFLWQEVTAKPLLDPDSGKRLVIISQHDVTSLVSQAASTGAVSDVQLELLSSIFPRHVLEHLLVNILPASVKNPVASSGSSHAMISTNLLARLPSQLAPSSKLVSKLDTPHHLARIATKGFETLARSHQDVTILFMDIVGFTSMSKQVPPASVMAFLNKIYSLFDQLTDIYDVQKIETAGDCYVAASGILKDDGEGFSVVKESNSITDATRNAMRMLQFAKAMLIASKRVIMPHNGQPALIRIGLHTGDCVTGLVGSKLPKFSVFGDTMNTASRMESTCTPGQIQVSESTWQLLKHVDQWRSTGGIEVKGKGLMNTYCWVEQQTNESNGQGH